MSKSKRAKVAKKNTPELAPWTVDQLLETIDPATLNVHFAPGYTRAFVSFEIPMDHPLAWFMTGNLAFEICPTIGPVVSVTERAGYVSLS